MTLFHSSILAAQHSSSHPVLLFLSDLLCSEQARQYLQPWFKIWRHAQQQPLVLPAALLLKPLQITV
jgi:hypothetical protein